MNELELKKNKSLIKIGINTALSKKSNTYIANNCPTFIIEKLKNANINFEKLEIDSENLGKILARNHNVVVISI